MGAPVRRRIQHLNVALRVVLDTNVVLSALVFVNGRVAPLRSAWQSALFVPLVSNATMSELMRSLAYPRFRLTTVEQRELLADYLPYCAAVRVPARPPKFPSCRDPADVRFLELAATGKADFLVTGDRDLLSLELELPCPIVTPGAFLASLAAT
ncbi:putative toxin-antitoxin system toxin component, PIN family [Accumulibacter sp.]|uniref:putative toxin-antitoxin system toxin component, PIN family n=1 Tax=Accumulibacter sp. TaxID=2053492 RepID=UPI0025F6601B|nr:putative toxin-antitoxin system toxin component, PIN family [Accumulibacter sp.]MCM8625075.1 putative toxin-antitoxin system toxin component, PIN family [Accumulibacter sp.]